MADTSATDMLMITVITEECNEISQDFYDAVMDSIQISQIECSCGHSGCLVGHGSYTRSLKTALGKIPLLIRRVQCDFCNATHALHLSGIVPYSQVPLSDHALTVPCLCCFGRQFMQIKSIRNVLFAPPT